MPGGQCYRWHFTLWERDELLLEESSTIDAFRKLLGAKEVGKYCFQLERGQACGRLHYQGRIGFIKDHKKTLSGVKNFFHDYPTIHLSREKDEEKGQFYVCKEETRVAGPWSDKDKPMYIPRQLRNMELRGWQRRLASSLQIFDTRRIHFVLDKQGNIGKSTFCLYMKVHHKAIMIPQLARHPQDLMQWCLKMVGERRQNLIFLIDMPRAMDPETWPTWITTIEILKNGWAFDMRYTANEAVFDSPAIAIFANSMPDRATLSADRWTVQEPGRYDAEDNIIEID